jgi:tRNA A-37 threonylcarbamoyl transferase component Bud32
LSRLEPGTILAERYRIESLLARGGMSRIYVATPLRGVGVVVIKQAVFTEGDRASELELAQFKAEHAMLNGLTHPALPTVLGFFEDGGCHYLVQEYLPGTPMRILLNEQGAFSVEETLALVRELLDALIYLHRRNIVHRDIKPENLLVTEQGRLRVLDFGAARLYSPLVSADAIRIGTLGYASPEHYSGQTDARSDIYSTGILMHFMLTGQVPPVREDYRPGPLEQTLAHVPDYLRRVLAKAIELDPKLRYQSARSMRAALNPPSTEGSQEGGVEGWRAWLFNLRGVHASARAQGGLESRESRFEGTPRILACSEPLSMPGASQIGRWFAASLVGGVLQAEGPGLWSLVLGGLLLLVGGLAVLIEYIKLRRRWQPFENFYVEVFDEGMALLSEPQALRREEFAWDEVVSYRLIGPHDSVEPYTAEIASRTAQAVFPDHWPLLGEVTAIVTRECYLQLNLARFDHKARNGRVVQAWEEVR